MTRRWFAPLFAAILLAPLSGPVLAQGPPGAPGAPSIQQLGGCYVTIRFTPAVGATSYRTVAQYNRAPVPTVNLGTNTAFTLQLPPGEYLLAIVAVNAFGETQGGPVSWIHCGGNAPSGPPGPPTLRQPTVAGNTVTLAWDDFGGGGPIEVYDIEAVIQATGQTIPLTVGGGQHSFTVPNVPAGNFLVRIRARNPIGASNWSAQRVVVVGAVLGDGDLQVTLTWNTTVDMDLHVIEPDGTHVFYGRRNGITARLDVDDTNGFGPENIFVNRGTATPGVYQIYVVQYGGSVPTTGTIAVRLNGGTPNEQFALFTRNTPIGNPRQGYNVANVNIANGTIVEDTGTRASDADERALTAKQ